MSLIQSFGQIPASLQGVAAATLVVWLGQAQQALQDLVTGVKPAVVLYGQGDGTKSVSYTRANQAELRARITELQQAINGGRPRRRALATRF